MYKKILTGFVFLLVVSMGFALAAQGDGVGNGSDGTGTQDGDGLQDQQQIQTRVQVQDGEHVGEDGQMFRIQTQANKMVRLETGGVSADCDCELKQEKVQNRTKLYAGLSNGKNSEVKIMPDAASEKALERLRLKVCSEENECQIELKGVGSGEKVKIAYELRTQRQAKVFGFIKSKMQVRAQVDAENGEIIKVKKPWWAFLASEPAE